MGNKRLKLAKGIGDFVPVSMNFSKLEIENDENKSEYNPSDDGFESERVQDNLVYEEMVVQILCNLDPREKLIFMYQLLRDGGYQIDHSAFAKTIHISRRQYMRVLDDVRTKSMLFIIGYKNAGKDCRVTNKTLKP
jgi:hypothetical protein